MAKPAECVLLGEFSAFYCLLAGLVQMLLSLELQRCLYELPLHKDIGYIDEINANAALCWMKVSLHWLRL